MICCRWTGQIWDAPAFIKEVNAFLPKLMIEKDAEEAKVKEHQARAEMINTHVQMLTNQREQIHSAIKEAEAVGQATLNRYVSFGFTSLCCM